MQDQPIPVFKPVPLQPVLQASQKVELKAIYRRLRRTIGAFDEEILQIGEDGLPLWDLTTPLPVSRHADWIKKGFEYVTLADKDSLEKVAPWLANMNPPLNARDFMQHPHFGAWNPKLYAATAAEGDRAAVVKMFDMLDKHGVETYEEVTGTKVPAAVIAAWKKRTAGPAAPRTQAPAAEPENLLDRAASAVTKPVTSRRRTKPAKTEPGAEPSK